MSEENENNSNEESEPEQKPSSEPSDATPSRPLPGEPGFLPGLDDREPASPPRRKSPASTPEDPKKSQELPTDPDRKRLLVRIVIMSAMALAIIALLALNFCGSSEESDEESLKLDSVISKLDKFGGKLDKLDRDATSEKERVEGQDQRLDTLSSNLTDLADNLSTQVGEFTKVAAALGQLKEKVGQEGSRTRKFLLNEHKKTRRDIVAKMDIGLVKMTQDLKDRPVPEIVVEPTPVLVNLDVVVKKNNKVSVKRR